MDAPEQYGLGLTKLERNSSTWKKLVDFFDRELIKLRVQNDRMENSEAETRNIRARIAVFNALLASGKDLGQDIVADEVLDPAGVLVAGNRDTHWSEQA